MPIIFRDRSGNIIRLLIYNRLFADPIVRNVDETGFLSQAWFRPVNGVEERSLWPTIEQKVENDVASMRQPPICTFAADHHKNLVAFIPHPNLTNEMLVEVLQLQLYSDNDEKTVEYTHHSTIEPVLPCFSSIQTARFLTATPLRLVVATRRVLQLWQLDGTTKRWDNIEIHAPVSGNSAPYFGVAQLTQPDEDPCDELSDELLKFLEKHCPNSIELAKETRNEELIQDIQSIANTLIIITNKRIILSELSP